LKQHGHNVVRCGPQDSIRYTSSIRQGVCSSCGSADVHQEHTYTPDLLVVPRRNGARYYIETKGYIRAEERSLLRAARRANLSCDLRVVAQRDYRVGKGTFLSWCTKYLKAPVHVWNGDIPESWK
jgi:hypothetical protein